MAALSILYTLALIGGGVEHWASRQEGRVGGSARLTYALLSFPTLALAVYGLVRLLAG